MLATLAGCAAGVQTTKGGLVPFETAGTPGAGGRKLALVIGVGEFEDPGWKALRWASKDATDFAAILEGFASVKVLKTKEETSRASILAALKDLKDAANRPDDTVVVYVSSHGTLDRPPGGALARYIVSSDTRKRIVASTAVSVAEVLRTASEIPSGRKALVFAFCHSGKGKSVLTDDLENALSRVKGGGFFVRPLEDVSEATIVVSASAWGETAAEDDTLHNDIYTHFLVEGATSANGDRNNDGAVTVTEAHDYARDRTYYFTQGRQKPSIELHLDGADPVVLRGARTRAGKPVAFTYAASASGLTVYVDGRKKGDLPGSVVVDEGSHRIELVDEAASRRVYSGKADFAAGEVVELSRLIPPPVTVQGGLGVGVAGFFRRGFASSVLGTSPDVTASFHVRDLPWRGLDWGLWADYLRGSGTIPVSAATVSYRTDAVGLRLGPGTSLRLRDFRLSAHLAAGLLWLRREASYAATAYHVTETTWGATLSLPLGVEYNLWGPLWLTVSGGPGVLFTTIAGSDRAEPFASATLLFSVGR
jgi:hypothetical protein